MTWHKNALNIICLVWPVCSWQLPPRNAWSRLRDLAEGGGSVITRTMVTDSGNNVSWAVRVLQFLDSLRISRHVLVVQIYWASEARHIRLVSYHFLLSNDLLILTTVLTRQPCLLYLYQTADGITSLAWIKFGSMIALVIINYFSHWGFHRRRQYVPIST